jgi:creatinine amidohydrolase
MENFPWTRLEGVAMPNHQVNLPDRAGCPTLVGTRLREFYQEGNFEGYFQRPDTDMHAIWDVAVRETRALISDGWDD